MFEKIGLPVVAGSLVLTLSIAHAGTPVAVVEDVGEGTQSLQLFEFVEAGRIIKLAAGERIVLGYMSGCLQEEIIGGVVTVGNQKSTVNGGRISVETVECDGGGLVLTAEQKGKSGVQVVRADEASGASGEKRPSLTVYSANPLIVAAGATGSVRVERLDRGATTLEIPLIKGIADLAVTKNRLSPGGIYEATTDERSVVFRVDRYARPGGAPALSRMVRL